MSTITKASTVNEVVDAVRTATRTLRQQDNVPTLDPHFAAVITRHLFMDKPGSGHPKGKSTRIRNNPGLLSTEEVECFTPTEPTDVHGFQVRTSARITGRIIKWHTGNGDLHALFAAQWDAGKLFEPLDTLAQTILLLSGTRFAALRAWQDTGLVAR